MNIKFLALMGFFFVSNVSNGSDRGTIVCLPNVHGRVAIRERHQTVYAGVNTLREIVKDQGKDLSGSDLYFIEGTNLVVSRFQIKQARGIEVSMALKEMKAEKK